MNIESQIATIKAVQAQQDSFALDEAIELIWSATDLTPYTDILNELLVDPNHHRHQEIARALQALRNPTSVSFADRALATHFDYLSYTCSESGVIAKWFSHLLFDIGTVEAFSIIEKYAEDSDDGIRNEMQYRQKNNPMKTSTSILSAEIEKLLLTKG